GPAVRAGERGRLGGFATERQRGLRARLGILCRGLFRLLGGAGQRLGPSLPLARRIPPQEEDREVRDDREDGDLGERVYGEEEAVQRRAGRADGGEARSRVGQGRTPVGEPRCASQDLLPACLIDKLPSASILVPRP